MWKDLLSLRWMEEGLMMLSTSKGPICWGSKLLGFELEWDIFSVLSGKATPWLVVRSWNLRHQLQSTEWRRAA